MAGLAGRNETETRPGERLAISGTGSLAAGSVSLLIASLRLAA
jgi:hypothetical protein